MQAAAGMVGRYEVLPPLTGPSHGEAIQDQADQLPAHIDGAVNKPQVNHPP